MNKLILNTSRLFLRPFQEKDALGFYNMNLDEDVMRYTGDLPFTSVDAARAFIQNYDQYERYKMGRLTIVLKDTEDYLGWCGLKYHADTDEVDLGFRLKKTAWGQGFAKEAAQACLTWGFQSCQLHSIIARARKENKASVSLLEQLGFEWELNFKEEGQLWSSYRIVKRP